MAQLKTYEVEVNGQKVTMKLNEADAERYGVASTKKRTAQNKAAQPTETKSLDDMTKAELLDEADRRGVDVNTSDTKAEILEALNE